MPREKATLAIPNSEQASRSLRPPSRIRSLTRLTSVTFCLRESCLRLRYKHRTGLRTVFGGISLSFSTTIKYEKSVYYYISTYLQKGEELNCSYVSFNWMYQFIMFHVYHPEVPPLLTEFWFVFKPVPSVLFVHEFDEEYRICNHRWIRSNSYLISIRLT